MQTTEPKSLHLSSYTYEYALENMVKFDVNFYDYFVNKSRSLSLSSENLFPLWSNWYDESKSEDRQSNLIVKAEQYNLTNNNEIKLKLV